MRLFIAIPLSEPTQKALGNLITVLREVKGVRGTFPRATNLHLTVQFLGDVPESKIPGLREKLTNAVQSIPAQEPLVLEQIGTFPNLRNPRVVWVGGIATPELKTLSDAVKMACIEAGTPPDDKGFVPHVTIMRIRELFDVKTLQTALMRINYAPQTIPIQQIVLFKSEITETGPIYTALANWVIGERNH